MRLRTEATVDDPSTIALLHGPVVLAADMGPASEPFEGTAPALVAAHFIEGLAPVAVADRRFRTNGIARTATLAFAPFYAKRSRRTPGHFRSFHDAAWDGEPAANDPEPAGVHDLDACTVDRGK